MAEDASVAFLVKAALEGDQEGWNRLVDRFVPLVFAVIRRYPFSTAEQQDISQSVWLKVLEHLGRVRDPQALPGWIAVTTRHEALYALRIRRRTVPFDPQTDPDFRAPAEPSRADDELLRAERAQMIRDGLAELPVKVRDLLTLLVQDPPLSYQEISVLAHIPVGSIGPLRARYLERLRGTAPMRRYFSTESVAGQA